MCLLFVKHLSGVPITTYVYYQYFYMLVITVYAGLKKIEQNLQKYVSSGEPVADSRVVHIKYWNVWISLRLCAIYRYYVQYILHKNFKKSLLHGTLCTFISHHVFFQI